MSTYCISLRQSHSSIPFLSATWFRCLRLMDRSNLSVSGNSSSFSNWSKGIAWLVWRQKKMTLIEGEDTLHGKAPLKASNFLKIRFLCKENQERNMGMIFKWMRKWVPWMLVTQVSKDILCQGWITKLYLLVKILFHLQTNQVSRKYSQTTVQSLKNHNTC